MYYCLYRINTEILSHNTVCDEMTNILKTMKAVILYQVGTPRYKMSEGDRVHNDYRPATIDILEYRDL